MHIVDTALGMARVPVCKISQEYSEHFSHVTVMVSLDQYSSECGSFIIPVAFVKGTHFPLLLTFVASLCTAIWQ